MALIVRTEPASFQEPTLGRLLLGHLQYTQWPKVSTRLKPEVSDDAAISQYLALTARSVHEGVPVTKESLKAGVQLEAEQFARLSDLARDAVAQAALDNWQIKPHGLDIPTGERPVKTLRRLLEMAHSTHEQSQQKIKAQIESAMELSNGIKGQFGFLEPPRFDPAIFSPPPNPLHKTNVHLDEANQHLANVRGDLDRLVEITKAQAEMIQTLSDTAALSLQQSISAGDEAKKATSFAKWGVFVSVAAALIALVAVTLDGLSNDSAERDASHITKQVDALVEMQRSELKRAETFQSEIVRQRGTDEASTRRLESLIEAQSRLIGLLESKTGSARHSLPRLRATRSHEDDADN